MSCFQWIDHNRSGRMCFVKLTYKNFVPSILLVNFHSFCQTPDSGESKLLCYERFYGKSNMRRNWCLHWPKRTWDPQFYRPEGTNTRVNLEVVLPQLSLDTTTGPVNNLIPGLWEPMSQRRRLIYAWIPDTQKT